MKVDPWPTERVEQLKDLLTPDKMLSYRQIADLLGTTKGAIAGFVNRKLPAFVRGHPKAQKQKKARKPKEPKVIIEPVVLGSPKPLKKPWDTIDRGECAYIHGHPFDGDWLYCGHETAAPSSYCQYHDSITKLPKTIVPSRLDKVNQLSQE